MTLLSWSFFHVLFSLFCVWLVFVFIQIENLPKILVPKFISTFELLPGDKPIWTQLQKPKPKQQQSQYNNKDQTYKPLRLYVRYFIMVDTVDIDIRNASADT